MALRPIENIQNQALLIRTKMAKLVAMSVPRSAIAEYDENGNPSAVLVRWELDQMQKCADIGVTVLSPMIRDYEFTGRYKPYVHQLKICSFLTTNKRALCFADMGTGKSLAVVHCIKYLLSIGEIKRALIIAPLSTLTRTWVDEFFNVDPSITVTKLHGPKAKRVELAANGAQVHVINYEGISVIHNEIKANNYDCVVIDEVTSYSNHKSKRWKEAYNLFKDTKYVWGLTGTPILRGVIAAYGQAALVVPHNVKFRSFWEFHNSVQRKINDFLWVDRPEAHDIAFSMLRPAISIKKKDCIDLPSMVHVYREVELDKGQKAFYVKLKEESLVKDEMMQVTAVNAAVLAGKLIQVATGCIYDDDGRALEFDVSGRINETIDFIQKARNEASTADKGKTIVFAPFKHTAALIRKKLSEAKIVVDGKERKIKAEIIDGDVSAKRRDDIFGRFKEDNSLDVIVAIPQTMSHGLTLTNASCIVWFGPCTSAETYAQACNRIDRPGQTESMTIVHLYSTPAEWKLYSNLRENKKSENYLLTFYKDFLRGI
nr:MAG TPA_asm: Chromatin remodeling complex ATPase [Caudoviricetes sp.]